MKSIQVHCFERTHKQKVSINSRLKAISIIGQKEESILHAKKLLTWKLLT